MRSEVSHWSKSPRRTVIWISRTAITRSDGVDTSWSFSRTSLSHLVGKLRSDAGNHLQRILSNEGVAASVRGEGTCVVKGSSVKLVMIGVREGQTPCGSGTVLEVSVRRSIRKKRRLTTGDRLPHVSVFLPHQLRDPTGRRRQ